MPLSNSDYNELLRTFDLRRESALRDARRRTEEVYRACPEIRSLDEEIASAGIRAARARVMDPSYKGEDLSEELSSLRARRSAALIRAGYPEDYCEPRFQCPVCEDRGVVRGEKCACFLKEEAALLYGSFPMSEILEKENFAHFSFDWYSDKIIDENTGLSAKDCAVNAYRKAQNCASRIGQEDNHLLIYGKTGLGKTFLTHCIAKEALDASRSVLYFSAPDLMGLLSDLMYGRGGRKDFREHVLLSADLLIIDDLGTELTNAFVNSELFRLINDRILRKKSTVISTNLSIEELRDTYSDRIYSRIIRHFTCVKLIGTDIRLRKKLSGGLT